MSLKVALRQNATPVVALIAGPALLWAAFTHGGNTKARLALGAAGGALLLAAYPQLRHAVRAALGVSEAPQLAPPPVVSPPTLGPAPALGPAPEPAPADSDPFDAAF